MPSPFPGMDPYLEGSLWTTVHTALSNEIARQLAPRLRPRYLALPNERFVMDEPDDIGITRTDIYPDVGVVDTRQAKYRLGETVVKAEPLRFVTVIPAPIPLVSIEIRDVAHRELVTVIEVLSPANKRGKGRGEYLARRGRILHSDAHLMEIDLLRQGERVPMTEPLPPAPYFVFLSRQEKRPVTEVWPIELSQPLPVVPVPLLPPDPDVPLDLQLALTTIYDLLGYDLAVDYTHPPEISLPEEAAVWVEQRLREAGKRPQPT